VRPEKVDVGVAHSPHPDVVVGAGQAGRERADEHHRAVPRCHANSHPDLEIDHQSRHVLVIFLNTAHQLPPTPMHF